MIIIYSYRFENVIRRAIVLPLKIRENLVMHALMIFANAMSLIN